MSSTEKAIGVVKSVLLFNERLEAVQKQIEQLRGDLSTLARDLIDVDRRVSRIEGVMEGYGRAAAQAAPRPRQKRLPKE